ncbi:MAG: SH3 domain-containing protein [Paracoccaceae bacterium]
MRGKTGAAGRLAALGMGLALAMAWAPAAPAQDSATGAGDAAKAAPRDPGIGPVTRLPLPRYVSLKTDDGNVRRGPGLTHRIDWVFTVAGLPLRVTAEYENWRRVEDVDGAGGWVHYSLLSSARTVLVVQDMSEFLNRPEQGAPVVFLAEYGVLGRVLECSPDWCRIAVEGRKGWVPKAALWGVEPGEVIE